MLRRLAGDNLVSADEIPKHSKRVDGNRHCGPKFAAEIVKKFAALCTSPACFATFGYTMNDLPVGGRLQGSRRLKSRREDIMKGIATALASIMATVAKAIGSVTWRWCQKTGTWIQERVVQPALDFTTDVASGTLAGLTGFIPDVLRSTFKLPGNVIRGTGAVLEGGGRLAGSTIKAVAAVPAAVASGIASGLAGGGGGGSGAMMPPPPAPESKAEKAVTKAVDLLEQRRLLNAGIRRTDAMLMRRSDTLGEAIWSYASAGPGERVLMDLGDIPEAIRTWLLVADESQLAKLASAGPQKCGLAATGARTGIVGLAIPTVTPEPMRAAVDQPTRAETIRDLLATEAALAARIAAARGLESGRYPTH